MQASTINDNPMSSQLHYLPDEDLADTFPYFLDPQQEDNLTVDIIQLYQVNPLHLQVDFIKNK